MSSSFLDALVKLCEAYYEKVNQLEGEKYDMEKEVELKDYRVCNIVTSRYPMFLAGTLLRERCTKKKLKKNLTSVSFAFTHTYTAVKTNSFRFFPQAYMENFEKCAKTQKQKNNMLSHVTCGC